MFTVREQMGLCYQCESHFKVSQVGSTRHCIGSGLLHTRTRAHTYSHTHAYTRIHSMYYILTYTHTTFIYKKISSTYNYLYLQCINYYTVTF